MSAPYHETLSIYETPVGRMLLGGKDPVSECLSKGMYWDEPVREAIEKHCRQDRFAIDIGAFVGHQTIHMARRSKHVFSFEPQRVPYYQLQANLALNDIGNVTAFNVACYSDDAGAQPRDADERGIGPRYSLKGNIAAAAVVIVEGPVDGETVQAVRLDSAIPAGLDFGFIKCDAQGCDLPALQGCMGIITAHRPVIVFEFEHALALAHGSTWQDYEEFFVSIGYGLTLIDAKDGQKRADYLAVSS